MISFTRSRGRFFSKGLLLLKCGSDRQLAVPCMRKKSRMNSVHATLGIVKSTSLYFSETKTW